MDNCTGFRAAAANCRLLARSMVNPGDSQKLLTLATEFDELAHAVEAVEIPENAAEAERAG